MTGVVLLRSPGGAPSSSADFTISDIGGQMIPTYLDTNRSKQLSISEQILVWSENQLVDLDWINVGNASDAESGYFADLNGTIVFASAHCENTGVNEKDIHVYVNGSDVGNLGNLSSGSNASFINTTVNIDFSQGDLIRLRAHGSSTGPIQDTVVKLTVKWRA